MILAFLMYTVPFSNMEGRFVSAAAPGRCFRSCRILSHSACLRDQDLEDSYIIKDRTGGFNNHILLEGRQNRIKIYRPPVETGRRFKNNLFLENVYGGAVRDMLIDPLGIINIQPDAAMGSIDA